MLGSHLGVLRTSLFMVAILPTPLATVAQRPPVEMSVSAADTGAPMIQIANRYGSPMTAFLVTVDLTKSNIRLTRLYFDVYANNYGRSASVLSGASTEMPLPHWVGAALPTPVLRAAIFEDGATWGDSPWVTELLEMRKILWLRTGEAIAVLRGIADLPVDKSVNALRWARHFRKEAVTGAPAEKRLMHDWLFSMALKNLDENSLTYNKPAGRSLVIEHFIKYFDDWRATLEAAKPSIAAWTPSSPSAVDLESHLISAHPRRFRPGFLPTVFYPSRAYPPQGTLPTCTTTIDPAPPSAGGNNASKVTAVIGVCGNQTWELIADFGGQFFDEGSQEAFGVCTGGYQDCAGAQVPQGKELGDVVMFADPSPPAGTIGFGWHVQSWVDLNGNCSSCPNPNPQGQTQNPVDHGFPTPFFFVKCQ